jgi:hypothetical protein
MMLCSEEVRRPLQRPVSFLLTSEVQHVNHIDRSFGAVFARWRGLGILSLPRLGRTRDAHLTHLDGVHEGSGLGDRPRTLFEFFQHMWAHLKSSRLWASQESRKSHGLECNFARS